MKRRRINLLSLTLQRFDFEAAIKKIQYSLIGVLVFLLILLVLSAFINNYLDQETEAVAKSKRPLTQYFQINAEFDKNIKYFIYKNNLLKQYIKEDANAYSQYISLLQHIGSVSPEAQVTEFTVDNTGQTKFIVNFMSYDNAQVFLDAIEKPEFIEPFEFIKIEQFSITERVNGSFPITIEGKFLKK